MPLNRNCTSGGWPAAAAFVNRGMTLFVSMSVGFTPTPLLSLNFASVSVIHFWMPTASCCPHHHIFSVAGPALWLPPPPPPPHAAARGPSPAASRPPAEYLSS